jgi:hypothetical protein
MILIFDVSKPCVFILANKSLYTLMSMILLRDKIQR